MTIDTICPDCGTLYTLRRELLGKRTKCTRCGGHFIITEAPPAAAPAAKPAPTPTLHSQEAFTGIPTHLPPPTHSAPPIATPSATRTERPGEFFGFESNASEPRFPAMRMVARAYEIMAIIVLVFAALLLLLFFIAVIRTPSEWFAAMFSSGFMFAAAFVTALMFLFAAQAIRLGLQIEQNTRESAQACRQLAEHFSAIQHEP
jgi:hypothetical protein